jgi:type II secretory pathway predicted ATPase ExeA
MRRLIEQRLLRHFGIQKQEIYWSPAMEEFKDEIVFSVENNQMLTLSGAIGSGKSMLLNSATAYLPEVTFVYVQNYFKEKMTISSIMNALIYDLSDESPRRDLEARSRQVLRITGKKFVGEGKLICLVIEEAHRLHANTLRALKELREGSFMGKSPLFSVILIGHEELQAKLESRKEAYWRSQIMELNENSGWMTLKERLSYVKHIFGQAITDDARKRIVSICKTPLQIDFYIENKMREARRAGKRQLDGDVIKPTPLEVYEANKGSVSYNEIAKEMGVSKSTAFDAVNVPNHNLSDAALKAVSKLTQRKAS